MLRQPLIIARKEIRDHLRDTRSLISSTFYALMGPLVVGMISVALRGQKSSAAITGMVSVFALVAAFIGGMNVAIDAIAGERERRSLLPLLINPLLRREIVLGKWIAITLFAGAGLLLNLAGFAFVVPLAPERLLTITLTLIPLAAFAAALELLISTWCRNIKEAHTYLSLIIFLPMGLGMYLVFFPQTAPAWFLVPVAGQQLFLELLATGGRLSLLPFAALILTTLSAVAALLQVATRLLHHDDVVYGG